MFSIQSVRPARSYPEALERIRAFQAHDDDSILPAARTAFLDCGEQTELAVVLLHGFTNHPGQYAEFAPMVRARGANVFIPRLPEQGDKDRMTTRLARLTAEELLASASEAVDIACGLGHNVCVLGISSSGVLCAYFAQYRADVARAIGVAPFFALLQLPYWLSSAVARAALVLPNRFVWWDPRLKERQMPPTAYPRFPTRALAQTLRIAGDVYNASQRVPLAAQAAVMVTNQHDPAVNNRVTARVVAEWSARAQGRASQILYADLPHNHDIIDPENPQARTDLVYPRLLELIFG